MGLRSRTVTIAAAVALVLGASLVAAWIGRPHQSAFPEIAESSGLAVSRRTPGLLWSHNDSGSAAVLFALDTTGTVRGRVRVPIRALDWEDVSAARCPSGNCL